MLRIQVQQRLGDLQLDTDLALPMRGVSALFGRSGAGKTSLVNLLSGLSQPDQGLIAIGDFQLYNSARGLNLAPEKRHIGYVFQDARLFPHYSVRGNLNYGNTRQDTQQFATIVELLGIEHLLSRLPASLSGGEKQRVAIGRALLSNPQMLLMDEPLASLDEPRKAELLPYLERLAKDVNIPILYVSHNLDEILRLADTLILLDAGKVVQCGPLADVWSSPEMLPWLPEGDLSVVLEATLAEQHPDYRMSRLALSAGVNLWTARIAAPLLSPVRVRIHARDVSLVRQPPQQSSIRNILPVKIQQLTLSHCNEQCLVTLQAGSCRIKATISRWAADELNLTVGDALFAQIKGMSVSQSDWVS